MKRNHAALLLFATVLAIAAACFVVSSRYPDTWPADETEVELIVKMFPRPLELPADTLPRLNPAIAPVVEIMNLSRKATTWEEFKSAHTPASLPRTAVDPQQWAKDRAKLPEIERYLRAVLVLRSKSTSHAFVLSRYLPSVDGSFQLMQGDMVTPLILDSKSGWLIDTTLTTTQFVSYLVFNSYATRYLLAQDHEGLARKVPDIKRRYRQEFILHDPERVVLTTREIIDTGETHIKDDTP